MTGFIPVKLSDIRAAAADRPIGYEADVLSGARRNGEIVLIPRGRYLELQNKYCGRTPRAKPPREQENQRLICGQCEWLHQDLLKCIHPAGACPKAPARTVPWENLTACPMAKW